MIKRVLSSLIVAMVALMLPIVVSASDTTYSYGDAAYAEDNNEISTSSFEASLYDALSSLPNVINLEFIELEDGDAYFEFTIIEVDSRLRLSGTHHSTYDMTGGLFSSLTWNFTSIPTFTVTLTPRTWHGPVGEVDIGIYLQRQGPISWSTVASARVRTDTGGQRTLTGTQAGNHRIYLRNYSGWRTTGDITISWRS